MLTVMSGTTYKVNELARLAGVTVRTLHYYDEIGLLVPSDRSRAGYRLYGADDLLRLQQILLGRELGLPLDRIKQMLDAPGFDRRLALQEHREQLVQRARTTEAMIRSVDAALAMLEGEQAMDPKQLFDGFDPAEHAEEARQRWGHTDSYKEAGRRTKRYSPADWARIKAEHDGLMKRLAEELANGASPQDETVLDLAEGLRLHIDRWYYPCSHAMHAGLAEMYVSDERFAAAFEKHGAGLAQFVADAIRANAAGRLDKTPESA